MRLGYDFSMRSGFSCRLGSHSSTHISPTLEIHIRMLRELDPGRRDSASGDSSCSGGLALSVCLTHDIDFVGIRNHSFDHSMWGFLYRATAGAFRNLLRGRLSLGQLLKSWLAVASLPFVYAGWAKDFWEPFEWYFGGRRRSPNHLFPDSFQGMRRRERPWPRTLPARSCLRLDELSHWTATLKTEGCELGVHGVDAWHSVEKGRTELAKIAGITGESIVGIRMHWLLQDANTVSVLEEAATPTIPPSATTRPSAIVPGPVRCFDRSVRRNFSNSPCIFRMARCSIPKRLDLSEQMLKNTVVH